jgi:aminopeptidase N
MEFLRKINRPVPVFGTEGRIRRSGRITGWIVIIGLVWFLGWGMALNAAPLVIQQHDISLHLKLNSHEIQAVDRLKITPPNMPDATVILNKKFKVQKVYMEGKEITFKILKKVKAEDVGLIGVSEDNDYYARAQGIRFEIPDALHKRTELNIEITYRGEMYDTVSTSEFSRTTVKDQTIGIVGEEGVFLTPAGIYYPTVPEGMPIFRVSVALPSPYECVTEGRRTQRIESKDSIWTVWEGEHPSDGINVEAGKYVVGEYPHKDLMIYTYLFPADSGLASMYVPMIMEFMDIYEQRIGPYPYKKFALVENFFETGYGMPSWTLLGPNVMKMSFVMAVSLPHEILHNWWGNGVFVDYEQGNWCEGLTTYMANYFVKERESKEAAKEYRQDALREYASYVDKAEDYPLAKFVERHEAGDRAIGYGKSMMVFHGLRMMVGDDSFYEALRRVYAEKLFTKATWADFRTAFEWVKGEDLSWYFNQWVNRAGAPQISLGKVEKTADGPMFKVTAEINQTAPVFRLEVPVVVTTVKEMFRYTFDIDQAKQIVTLDVDSAPLTVAVDPDFDVFRRLDIREMPPTVARVYGDKNLLVVLPSSTTPSLDSAYQEVSKLLTRTGEATTVMDTKLTDKQIQEKSLFLLGSPKENLAFLKLGLSEERFKVSPVGMMIGETKYISPDVAVAVVTNHPMKPEKVVAFLFGMTPEGIKNAGDKLPHYGKYSWVTFKGVERWDRGTWEVTESPLKYTFK